MQFHFIKIGDVITKYAEGIEKLTPSTPPSAIPSHSYTPTTQPAPHDNQSQWYDMPRLSKQPRDPLSSTRYLESQRQRDVERQRRQRDRQSPLSPYYQSEYHRHHTNPESYLLQSRHDPANIHDRRSSAQHSLHRSPSDDPHMSATRLKRRSPLPITDLEDTIKPSSPHLHVESTRPSSFRTKQPKRIRINWSQSENDVFFETIQKFDTKDESALLKEIVAALNGSRNWVQCKGHFRNLQFVGRISQTTAHPKKWLVNDPAKTIKPTSGGTSSGGVASASVGVATSGSHESPNIVDTSKDPTITGDKNDTAVPKRNDNNDDSSHTQKFVHPDTLHQELVDFEQKSAALTGSDVGLDNKLPKTEVEHELEEREQIIIHDDDHDVDEDELVEDTDYPGIGKDGDKSIKNIRANGHRSDVSKHLLGLMVANRDNVDVDLGVVSAMRTALEKPDDRDEADQSDTHDEEMQNVSTAAGEKSFETKNNTLVSKKLNSPAYTGRGINMAASGKRRYVDVHQESGSIQYH